MRQTSTTVRAGDIMSEFPDYIPVDHPTETMIPDLYYFNGVVANVTFKKDEACGRCFMNGVLFNVTFEICKLNQTNFMNAYLICCKFIYCDLTDTSFMNVNLINTNFMECSGTSKTFMNVLTLDSSPHKNDMNIQCYNTFDNYTYYTKYHPEKHYHYAERIAENTRQGRDVHYLDQIFEYRLKEYEKIVDMKMLSPANLSYVPDEKSKEIYELRLDGRYSMGYIDNSKSTATTEQLQLIVIGVIIMAFLLFAIICVMYGWW